MYTKIKQEKRARAPNFSAADIDLLCSLIEQKKTIIENKKTDGVSIKKKQEAWKEITASFNSRLPFGAGYCRTAESLQLCYNNLKKRTRKRNSDENMEATLARQSSEKLISAMEDAENVNWVDISQRVGDNKWSPNKCRDHFKFLTAAARKDDSFRRKDVMKTGGGSAASIPHDTIFERVKGLMGSSINGIVTKFDSDYDYLKEQNVNITAIEDEPNNIFTHMTISTKAPEDKYKCAAFTSKDAAFSKNEELLMPAFKKKQREVSPEFIAEEIEVPFSHSSISESIHPLEEHKYNRDYFKFDSPSIIREPLTPIYANKSHEQSSSSLPVESEYTSTTGSSMRMSDGPTFKKSWLPNITPTPKRKGCGITQNFNEFATKKTRLLEVQMEIAESDLEIRRMEIRHKENILTIEKEIARYKLLVAKKEAGVQIDDDFN